MRKYTTRNEAIQAEIIEPLGKWIDQFDVDMLTDLCIEQHANGTFFCTVTSEEFWECAEECSVDVCGKHEQK